MAKRQTQNTATPRKTKDPESHAIDRIISILKDFDRAARIEMMEYVAGRFRRLDEKEDAEIATAASAGGGE